MRPEPRSPSVPVSIAERIHALTSQYQPLPGTPDEFIGIDGARRPHWDQFLEKLAALAPSETEARFAAADRRIRDMGMAYRVRGETVERLWPLSRLPLLLPESEWSEIAKGVTQRAELLERTLADIYGPGQLVGEGVLPAAASRGPADKAQAGPGLDGFNVASYRNNTLGDREQLRQDPDREPRLARLRPSAAHPGFEFTLKTSARSPASTR